MLIYSIKLKLVIFFCLKPQYHFFFKFIAIKYPKREYQKRMKNGIHQSKGPHPSHGMFLFFWLAILCLHKFKLTQMRFGGPGKKKTSHEPNDKLHKLWQFYVSPGARFTLYLFVVIASELKMYLCHTMALHNKTRSQNRYVSLPPNRPLSTK